MTQYLEQIKQRKIPQTLAIYLASAWACVEAFSVFEVKYQWPSYLFEMLVYVLLSGIPFILLNTWFRGEAARHKFRNLETVLYSINALLLFFLVWLSISSPQKIHRKINGSSDKSIVVLPFRNLNNEIKDDFIADGVTEDIISRISQLGEFRVISRTSSFHYKNTTLTLPQIGKELDVANVLEGSVQRFGERMRISVKLVDASTDETVWAQVFDGEITEIFNIQSQVAGQVSKVLEVKLSPSEQESLGENLQFNIDSYRFYQQGLAARREGQSEENLKNAIKYFERSIEVDSTFYLAYIGIAETYIDFAFWGRSSGKKVAAKAKDAAQRALELNNRSGKVYGVLAAIEMNFNQDWKAFHRYWAKANSLEPNHSILYYYMAEYHCLKGNTDLAIEYIDKAIMHDPKYDRYKGYKGQIYYFGRRFDDAINTLQSILNEQPDNNFALFVLGEVYSAQNKYDLAIPALQRRTVGSSTNFILALTYGRCGKHAEASRIFNFLLEKSKVNYVPSTVLGYAYLSVGKNEEAITSFENHYNDEEGGMSWLQFIKFDPLLDPLRDAPRFKALINKMNL
jgi:adenylate cyclase